MPLVGEPVPLVCRETDRVCPTMPAKFSSNPWPFATTTALEAPTVTVPVTGASTVNVRVPVPGRPPLACSKRTVKVPVAGSGPALTTPCSLHPTLQLDVIPDAIVVPSGARIAMVPVGYTVIPEATSVAEMYSPALPTKACDAPWPSCVSVTFEAVPMVRDPVTGVASVKANVLVAVLVCCATRE